MKLERAKVNEITNTPHTKLIVYGSLAPGESNHFLLTGLVGEWHRCQIRGHMGNCRGFKSFRYDHNGLKHPAWLLISPELPGIIADLDDFEGEEYERIIIPALVDDRWVMAQIYEGRDSD
jgi:gamma-glutamylcyclotransferase (GGCT)/AIG2-like uncharacterized protein YtfP